MAIVAKVDELLYRAKSQQSVIGVNQSDHILETILKKSDIGAYVLDGGVDLVGNTCGQLPHRLQFLVMQKL